MAWQENSKTAAFDKARTVAAHKVLSSLFAHPDWRRIAAAYRDYTVLELLRTARSSHVSEKSTHDGGSRSRHLEVRGSSMQLNFQAFTKSSAGLEGKLPLDSGSKGL
jgi:hypothetical protein